MTEDEFLVWLKLTRKVAAASKLKDEGIHGGKKSDVGKIQNPLILLKRPTEVALRHLDLL